MFLTVFPGGVSVARYCESYGPQAVFKVHLVDGAGKFDAPALATSTFSLAAFSSAR